MQRASPGQILVRHVAQSLSATMVLLPLMLSTLDITAGPCNMILISTTIFQMHQRNDKWPVMEALCDVTWYNV